MLTLNSKTNLNSLRESSRITNWITLFIHLPFIIGLEVEAKTSPKSLFSSLGRDLKRTIFNVQCSMFNE